MFTSAEPVRIAVDRELGVDSAAVPDQPLLFLLAIAGHWFASAAAVNRVHAQPWPCPKLKRWRDRIAWANAALSVGLLAWCYGPASPVRTVVLGLCASGLLTLLWVAVQHWRRRETPVVASSGQVDDLAGRVPIGDGPIAALARVPGNQFRQIETTDKTLALPGWPPGLTPLRVLHLTDWHFTGTPGLAFYQTAVERAAALDPDLILFSGDLVDRMDLLGWIDRTLGQLDAPLGKFFILGNHDWMQQPDVIRQAVVDAGWTDLASRTVTTAHDGQTIELAGNETPWMGTEPAFASDGVRIGVMHTPDRLPWAVGQRCDLVVAGHNHGGQIRVPGLGPLLAPARTGVRYAGGVYQKNRTVMHVGRGLGALHPLRINCRPEITLLTLVPVAAAKPALEPI